MPTTFSFTAPVISEENERQEREELTYEELEQLHRDVYGPAVLYRLNRVGDDGMNVNPDGSSSSIESTSTSSGLNWDEIDEMMMANETPETRAMAEQHVRDAIRDLPIGETLDYYEALDRVPQLVETESCITAFLRHEKYNTWAAAKCLTEYWKMRRLVFGMVRAFLPMTINGAMAEDRASLERGVFQILDSDEHGRPVFFWDRTRYTLSEMNRDTILRVFFYCMHVLSHNTDAQRVGYVMLVNARGMGLYSHFDRLLARRLLQIMNVVPVVYRAVHAFTGGGGQSVLGLVMPVIKQLGGRYYRLHFHMHSGTELEVVEKLEAYGIKGPHVRLILSLKHREDPSMFVSWLARQRQLELSLNADRIA